MPRNIRIAKQASAPRRAVEPVTPQRSLKLLSVQEAADYARVSSQTVRRWIGAGELKTYRAGRQIRIDEADLIRSLSTR